MEAWGRWLRSVQGQLSLLAFVFACAVVVGLMPWFLRSLVFQRFAREAYPKVEDTYAEKALPVLRRPGSTQAEIDAVLDEIRRRDDVAGPERFKNLERMYGQWMLDEDGTDVRPGGWLARRLTASDRRWLREWVMDRLRMTLAAGNVQQRLGAVEWIEAALGDEALKPEAADELRRMLERARDRARRRGEDRLAEEAAAALAKGRT
jgi:hypothetical protein